ncbi:MAG TPA: HipA family kinase [Terracidiphilus sp.]|nr:HipA family kinase [Terracidiphilus sp.]
MRGGAQSHLLRCADGFYYVVKFQNNPQHTRVLVNDWLGTRLAEMIGLPVPVPAIVDVHPWLLEHTPELRIEQGGRRMQFTPGLSFGSRYVVSPFEGQAWDYLPEGMMSRVRNVHEFAGVLAFDKWTCNANGRQAAFWKLSRQRKLTASFIDQGYCFNAGEWNFPDAPLRGVFGRNDVYAGITSWQSFEPWLGRIETFPESSLWPLAEEIPPQWYGGASDELERLLIQLLARRSRVRELILDFKNSSRNPFPNWKEAVH